MAQYTKIALKKSYTMMNTIIAIILGISTIVYIVFVALIWRQVAVSKGLCTRATSTVFIGLSLSAIGIISAWVLFFFLITIQ